MPFEIIAIVIVLFLGFGGAGANWSAHEGHMDLSH